jgi:hypothetical protein
MKRVDVKRWSKIVEGKVLSYNRPVLSDNKVDPFVESSCWHIERCGKEMCNE